MNDQQFEQTQQFNHIDDMLIAIGYEKAENRALWWHSEHPQIGGGLSAIRALLAGRGDEVERIVGQMNDAVYL